ncbi:MAG: tetratricopeptide repeat protein [Candidatus Omnitrophica bacterium]|nr:tetratricopeptide repeat protein [Candidatus Omnitrophota bacterium]MCB9747003.1 tetratricopeptide repeat protein [Candidatus Omnitrophota bacterium]
MKKSIILSLIILLFTFVVLSFLSRNGEYAAQRDLWGINLKLKQASKDPNNMPKNVFKEIMDDYDQFMIKHPNSRMRPYAHLISGRVYMLQRKFEQARQEFETILEEYPKETAANIQALAEIGRTYLKEDNGPAIVNTYERILAKYPLTELGLKVPLLRAEFYQRQNDETKTQQSYQNAADHYEEIIKQNPDSLIEYQALKYLGQSSLVLENWEKVVDSYGELLIKYPYPKYLTVYESDKIIKMITTISITKLKKYDPAKMIFLRFIERHPKHPFNETFFEMMKSFEFLKEETKDIE